MYGISNCLLNGPFRHVWKFSRFDMGAKRDPNFFQWYLCRFWRYPSGFNINAKYEKGQITWSYLFIFKMYESHRNKALIMSLFFAHFAYSHCQMQSLQQQVSDTPIFTASTYAYYSRCSLQSDMSLKVMNSVVGWRLAARMTVDMQWWNFSVIVENTRIFSQARQFRMGGKHVCQKLTYFSRFNTIPASIL